MKNKSVRISEIAQEFNLDPPLVEKMLAESWGNFMTLRKVLTYFKHARVTNYRMLEMCKDCAKRLRETWIVRNESALVDKLTLKAIATMARDAREGDAILEIILADD